MIRYTLGAKRYMLKKAVNLGGLRRRFKGKWYLEAITV
jgi:hypothetical protein